MTVSLLLLFPKLDTSPEQKILSTHKIVNSVLPSIPVRLVIPTIGVDANIQQVGVTDSGEMEVPSNIIDVGWFKLGTPPGQKGSAVISGHLDGKGGEPGVFKELNQLKFGDKLYVKDTEGRSISFTVQNQQIYNPGYAEDVFSRNDGTFLNLVTCDGIWDNTQKNYSKRLVVYAVMTPP